MAFELVILFAALAVANAGIAVTSTADNTYRSPGNLAQVSTQSKTIETPYSSSSKSDIRVSNPSLYATAAPAVAYSPGPATVYASPAPYVSHTSSAPSYATPGLSYYASPAISQYAAPPAAHYAAPAVAHYAAPAVAQYAAPAIAHYAAPAVAQYSAPVASYPAHALSYSDAGHSQQVYSAAPGPVVAKTAYASPVNAAHATPVATYSSAPAYSYGAPVDAHSAPLAHATYAAPAYAHAAHQPLVKVTFSPANEVAHLVYSNANDQVNYAW